MLKVILHSKVAIKGLFCSKTRMKLVFLIHKRKGECETSFTYNNDDLQGWS